ncbi:MAG: sulfite exporter TauE/SafE family protein [Roseococcus sp.]|nr:sulfite exporter TauE/SafE family protein [Roseococcus sp.]
MAALFLAGLGGGLTHCAGMCGPFVLSQTAAIAPEALGAGMWRRLRGAALLPYHAGRAIGYGLLGGVAGGAGALLAQASGVRMLAAVLLLLAALLMLAQASARFAAWLPRLPSPPVARALDRRLGPLLAAPTGWRGLRLGLLLSALPCGLLYGALAGAASSGSALAGTLAMIAFVAGTMPALVVLAFFGRGLRQLLGNAAPAAGAILFLVNAAVLTTLAARLAL